MSTKTGRKQRHRTRRGGAPRVASTHTAGRAAAPRKRAKRQMSPRWLLTAAIVTTLGAIADIALLVYSSGSDQTLYIIGLAMWAGLAIYHWRRWWREGRTPHRVASE